MMTGPAPVEQSAGLLDRLRMKKSALIVAGLRRRQSLGPGDQGNLGGSFWRTATVCVLSLRRTPGFREEVNFSSQSTRPRGRNASRPSVLAKPEVKALSKTLNS